MSTKYYESQQKILDRMLSRISGLSTIEGSTTYMQHSPIAIELENIKLQMDEIEITLYLRMRMAMTKKL